MKEFTDKSKIVHIVRTNEKKWNEKKRYLWVYFINYNLFKKKKYLLERKTYGK